MTLPHASVLIQPHKQTRYMSLRWTKRDTSLQGDPHLWQRTRKYIYSTRMGGGLLYGRYEQGAVENMEPRLSVVYCRNWF